MVSIKHKVTIKTKIAQEETPFAVESSVVTIKRKQQETLPPQSPQEPIPQTQEPVKNPNAIKIIGGIVAVVAIVVGIWFFSIKDKEHTGDNGGKTTEQVAQTREVPESRKAETTDETKAEGESTTSADAEAVKSSTVGGTPTAMEKAPSKVEEKNVDKPSSSKASASQLTKSSQINKKQMKTSFVDSESVNGDVEENARRVIRGDFGNGQTRKDKLGTSYSEIQGRVNEMYRQGLVH